MRKTRSLLFDASMLCNAFMTGHLSFEDVLRKVLYNARRYSPSTEGSIQSHFKTQRVVLCTCMQLESGPLQVTRFFQIDIFSPTGKGKVEVSTSG